MFSTEYLMNELDAGVQKILEKLKKEKAENQHLRNEIIELQNELNSTKKNIKALENKNKEIKVVSGLAGNVEHKRLMKHKLNSLIKEIDLCIAEVKQKSI